MKILLMKMRHIIVGWANLILLRKNSLSWERMGHCNNCEHNQGGWCYLCACYLDAKTRVDEEFCPMLKWGPVPKQS